MSIRRPYYERPYLQGHNFGHRSSDPSARFGDQFAHRTGDQLQDRSDHHGGSYSHGYGHDDCCPLVVDPLTLVALLGAVAAATAFFNVLITMNVTAGDGGGRMRKRKRSTNVSQQVTMRESLLDIMHEGKKIISWV